MHRRSFLRHAVAASTLATGGTSLGLFPRSALAAATHADYRKVLILVELKGGNDGLNTLVPYADPAYYALRPKLAVDRNAVVQLSDRMGFHPALAPLLPLWEERRLALLQGVGYPAPNLSHFRSIEIWDTASRSNVVLQDGWLTRTFADDPVPASFAADGWSSARPIWARWPAAVRAPSRSPTPTSSCAAQGSRNPGRRRAVRRLRTS